MFEKFWGEKNIPTNKVLSKIKEKKLDFNRVKKIANGDYTCSEPGKNGTKKYFKKIDGQWVGVVAKKDSHGTKIITAWKQRYSK